MKPLHSSQELTHKFIPDRVTAHDRLWPRQSTHQAEVSIRTANRQFSDVEAVGILHAQQVGVLIGNVVIAAAESLCAYVLQRLQGTAQSQAMQAWALYKYTAILQSSKNTKMARAWQSACMAIWCQGTGEAEGRTMLMAAL